VPSQSGQRLQDANHCLDRPENTRSIGAPHSGQSAGFSNGRRGRSGLRSRTQSSTSSRKLVTVRPQRCVPVAISSRVASIRAVNPMSTTSAKWALRNETTTSPSAVGKNRRDSLTTYSRCSSVEMIDA
jgi:hypothetical protein